jgi:hypothetical protein
MTRHRRLLLPTAPTRAAAPKWSAPFYPYLPAAPTTSDRAAARLYLDVIETLLDADDITRALSHQHRGNLMRLARRWQRRCAGLDTRWSIAGIRPGRLPKELEITREPHPLWRKDKP